MIAPAPSRFIVKQLKDAGFSKRDGKGSHTVWTCRHGRVEVSVTTGHKTISPGYAARSTTRPGCARPNARRRDAHVQGERDP